MPNMLGKEVAERIREISPTSRCSTCPATRNPSWPHRAGSNPASALIDKPFSEAALLEKAGQILNGHFRGFKTVPK